MLLHSDSLSWARSFGDKSVDHIITDYEYGTHFPFVEFLRVCRGTILTFCSDKDDPLDDNETERAYWIKTPSTKNYKKHLGRFVEHIVIFRQKEYDVFNTDLHWSNYTGVYNDVVETRGWKWKKPLSPMERLVRIYTNPGDIVADPYCGSGTTLQACKNLGRRWIGVDSNKKWFDYCVEQGLL